MANFVRYYTIAFETSDEQVTNRSIMEFFKKIEQVLLDDENKVVRFVDGKLIRCFNYYWNELDTSKVVITFGKLKDKNKPYYVDASDNKLKEIPQDLFDINSIAYDEVNKVMLFTTNNLGPKVGDVQDYLSTFIDPSSGYKISIRPLVINTGLERIRNAQCVRSVTFSLDLGATLNNFYLNQIDQNREQEQGLLSTFRNFISTSKESINSRTLDITMGLGRLGKEATLDVKSLLSLLEEINIDQDYVKEITVNYKNTPNEKVMPAKLKNSSIFLYSTFSIAGSQIGPEYLLNNCTDAIISKRNNFRSQVRDYFHNFLESDNDYNVISDYHGDTSN